MKRPARGRHGIGRGAAGGVPCHGGDLTMRKRAFAIWDCVVLRRSRRFHNREIDFLLRYLSRKSLIYMGAK
jgi:hypothetical protein